MIIFDRSYAQICVFSGFGFQKLVNVSELIIPHPYKTTVCNIINNLAYLIMTSILLY